MRYTSLLMVLFFAVATTLHAQDTLRKYNGRSYVVKVEEVTPFEIDYRRTPNGAIKSVSKSQIASIAYANGRRDSFLVIDPKKQIIDTTASHLTSSSLYAWGRADAVAHYPGSSTGNTVTFLFAFLGSPLLGLVPAIGVANAAPLPKNLNMPNAVLANNMYYRDGYMRKARSIKSGKTWISWGAGSVASVVAILLLTHAHS